MEYVRCVVFDDPQALADVKRCCVLTELAFKGIRTCETLEIPLVFAKEARFSYSGVQQ